MMLAIIIFLLYYFREKLNRIGKSAITLASTAYTVFTIHQTILSGHNVVFLPIAISSYLKFITVSLVGVPLCFRLALSIRKLPYIKKSLGKQNPAMQVVVKSLGRIRVCQNVHVANKQNAKNELHRLKRTG
jgi:membrane-bound acyltransferase YfiQ involved in biofilm formation